MSASRRSLTRDALSASGIDADPRPVRIVHLGLGAFHRAHQAWYTERVDEEREWGIAAFTGRSPRAATALAAQDGLYTLLTKHPDRDETQVIRALARVHDGADVPALREYLSRPETAIVTLTITEAGYPEASAWAGDAARMREGGDPETAIARLVAGLDARRRAGGGPLAVVSCDNLPDNGARTREVVVGIAGQVDETLADWIDGNVSFVSTSVDRITPRTAADDVAAVGANTGWDDRSPVVTEPFSDWILQGTFPAGRPPWERAGVRFVDSLEVWERRKLWLLNGAHTLLANAGPVRGHETVAEAIADPVLRSQVEALWDEAARHLPGEVEVPAYRAALLARFANPRIRHLLAQIAQDSLQKLQIRIAPVALAELAAGRDGSGCAAAIGAWVRQEIGADAAPERDRVAKLIARVDPELASYEQFVTAVCAAADRMH